MGLFAPLFKPRPVYVPSAGLVAFGMSMKLWFIALDIQLKEITQDIADERRWEDDGGALPLPPRELTQAELGWVAAVSALATPF